MFHAACAHILWTWLNMHRPAGQFTQCNSHNTIFFLLIRVLCGHAWVISDVCCIAHVCDADYTVHGTHVVFCLLVVAMSILSSELRQIRKSYVIFFSVYHSSRMQCDALSLVFNLFWKKYIFISTRLVIDFDVMVHSLNSVELNTYG